MTKIGLRNFWFQFHKWIGLILAILIIPLSLSGSALVWQEPIDRMFHPERYAVSGPARLAPGAYATAAAGALKGGERLARLAFPRESHEPVTATAMSPMKPGKRPVRATVYLDPADAHVIGVARSSEGVFPILHVLHGSLMVPGVGRQIVGWIGVAMAISCISGIWLWWPTVGSWVRGLRWRRHRNTDTNLHHLLGFWIAVPLFVLSFTGAWISFPQFFGMFDGARPRGGDARPPFARMVPVATTTTSLDQAVAAAAAMAPGKVRTVAWPTEGKAQWQIDIAPGRAEGAPGRAEGAPGRAESTSGQGEGRRHEGGGRPPVSVAVDDAGGTARLQPPARQGEGGQSLARLMRQIHDGDDMPFVWQIVIFIGGIVPAVLAVTGIIMWWRARGWRGELKARQRARAAVG